ncbi:Gfo/Idh/MocA family protein [Zhihengliuella halotolerans]|uniref:Putative dehydrogenase n=1 Tax=Zhihengliuella halotolerans TaxID=370736 RepID=A0A4Q8ADI9_9MICC|nr:Gfo/Idh/MocA family oxidoreductase [Zhihengliuella halotolerans]RZU62310.1 putative dehydrogenase [Zhihengliuella halotolerans]
MTAFATIPGGAPIRVVQVGAGGMGRNWLGAITANPDVELVGLVDLDLDAARAALDALAASGVPGTHDVVMGRSVADVAARSGAQAVVNVTVPVAHRPVNEEALFAGLPVLCEKPAAPTVAEALTQAASAAVAGQLLMISQSRRYFAALDALVAQVGSLGEIGTVDCSFFKAPRFGGFREEMDHVLLVDMAIHHFDAARRLIGSDPVAVYCEEHNPGWSWYRGAANASAVFEFASGARFVYAGSWCAPGAETSWNGSWRVSGERGTARWDGDGAPVAHLPPAPVETAVLEPRAEETAGALAEFVDCLRTGRSPGTTAAANVRSLAMVEAAIASSESGHRVLIDDVVAVSLAAAREREERPAVRAELDALGAGAFAG